jgi:predicted DNA-binding transcriptional regulator YafY
MAKSEALASEQPRRILAIYKLFLRQGTLTKSQVVSELRERFPYISERSIQRDLRVLADENFIELEVKGKYSEWKLSREGLPSAMPLKIKQNELLSFYMLKAYLKTFKGTAIEADLNDLKNKLEPFAPGNVWLEEQFYGDQNVGFYDYSNKHIIISLLLKNIIEKNWITIKYERVFDNKIKVYELFPKFLYHYSGSLYLVAYYSEWKKPINFLVQNIKDISESSKIGSIIPSFNFDEFRKQRFAVYDGVIHDIKLKIYKEYYRYFENRKWHPTQKIELNKDGDYEMRFKSPLAPDLVSWICRWTEALEVMEPRELKLRVIEIMNNSLKKYLESYKK